jgi:hypothetical protein
MGDKVRIFLFRISNLKKGGESKNHTTILTADIKFNSIFTEVFVV